MLLEALARLPLDLAWRFLHIGNGPMLDALRRRAKARGLSARITWFGARRHQEVLETYRAADLFVLASRIAKDSDRDGLPNVLMEAQSQGLACISTTVSESLNLSCTAPPACLFRRTIRRRWPARLSASSARRTDAQV